MADVVRAETIERMLERLGFAATPPVSLQGLNDLYRAWGRSVPFDNVRKRISLLTEDRGPLPGGHAEDFLQAWLAHGTGGTCWSSSNGLFALIDACGFEARRISASMRDLGEPNHASIVVRVAGADYLADSNMLTEAVIPLLRGEATEIRDPLHALRVEPVGQSFRIHFALPGMREADFVCGLLQDPVDHPFYLERYELTRSPDKSPFNAFLYASRNTGDAVLAYVGRTRIWKRDDDIEQTELAADALERSLVEDLDLSEEIVAQLAKHGALA